MTGEPETSAHATQDLRDHLPKRTINNRAVWLGLSTYAIKIIKCRALDLQRSGGDVISKRKRSVTSISGTRRAGGPAKKSRTGLRYQCKRSYHCSLRAGERRAVHCMAVDKRGQNIVTPVLFRCRLTHLNDSLGNFWGRENRKRGQHPVWVLLHRQRLEPQGETESHFIQEHTSRNFDSSKHPNPAPVPPPSEWMIWNP